MSRIYLCENFNNLSNKMCIVYDRIELYPQPVFEATVNFRPGDGVSTSLVLMYKDNVLAPPVNLEPDYAIVCADSGGGIESRWFVTESVRLSDSKFSLRLQRDVAADYKSNIMDSVAFVRRGWVDKSNPLIFNSENGSYSQILRERIDLKDKSGKGCYVAFLSGNFFAEERVITLASKQNADIEFGLANDGESGDYVFCSGLSDKAPVDFRVRATNDLYLSTPARPVDTIEITINSTVPADNPAHAAIVTDILYIRSDGATTVGKPSTSVARVNFSRNFLIGSDRYTNDIPRTAAQAVAQAVFGTGAVDQFLYAQDSAAGTMKDAQFLREHEGCVAFLGANQKNYKLRRELPWTNRTPQKLTTDVSKTSELGQIIAATMLRFKYESGTNDLPSAGAATINYFNYNWVWEEFVDASLTLPATARTLSDSPYYMMCIPEEGQRLRIPNNNSTITQQPDPYEIYNQLQLKFGEHVYDVQYLPYTPLQLNLTDDGILDISQNPTQVGIIKTTEGSTDEGAVYFVQQSEFTFSVDVDSESLRAPASSASDVETKINSELKVARLCSMDGQAQISLNPTKNLGLTKVQIYCRYAPFQSYFTLLPEWSIYYGLAAVDNDTRGLNFTTKSSMTRASNQWQEFVLNNVNYQEIFNRQIQSMDTQFDIQANAAVRNMVFGLLNTGAAAAMSGSPVSVIGGLAGGGLGLIQQGQEYVDMVNNFRENRSLSTDMFNLQNGNTKARANTLSTISALSPIYNTWPYIEVYGATSTESAVLRTYIDEFSMNIGAMTNQLVAYVQPNPNARKYIQADIVRLNGKFDAHMADTIKSVISNGIYFVEVTTNE